ncbi:PREDICTED: probable ATP-dependent RNA helicase DDX28 [Crocodylus porosus]|uniref:probable ATP-dependent RNA helicase DDX28 n=1 Tax=Crocodylus porosus TaxID=8502 RepID=UPI00093C7CCE|nr:PREDICTED: probable ATP-dependent RNA helicase DDX28 [Crocodylus porosus]
MALSAAGLAAPRGLVWRVLLRWAQSSAGAGAGAEVPEHVVRVPWAARQQQRRRRQRQVATGPAVPTRAGKFLLWSRRQELSQPSRLTLGRWEAPRLVSAGWKHRLSCGDYFQLERAQDLAPALVPPQAEGGDASFEALGLEPALVSALDALSFGRPTAVQRRTIPALLRGRHAICAAETGSGKTLAYLLPLLQRLLAGPRPQLRSGQTPSPLSLVLLPSRELAEQVRAVAASLCRSLGLRVREIGGGRGMGNVKRQLCAEPSLDVLLATPGALCKALRKQMVTLEQLSCLVLDEADTLLDPTFVELVEEVLAHAPLTCTPQDLTDLWDVKTQLVVVGATFPGGLSRLLSKFTDIGHFVTLVSQSLHCLLPHIQQKFVRIKGRDKVSELLQLIKVQSPSSGALLVFCNKAPTVNWLSYIFDDHKIKHLRLQGQMPAAVRAGIFSAFQKGEKDILVCTDLASRGLDTSRVELIVNYDFPDTLQDYLHRVGRVGRVGSQKPGSAISYVTHPWDVDLVRKIETAARRRTSLPGMKTSIDEPLPETDSTQTAKQQ